MQYYFPEPIKQNDSAELLALKDRVRKMSHKTPARIRANAAAYYLKLYKIKYFCDKLPKGWSLKPHKRLSKNHHMLLAYLADDIVHLGQSSYPGRRLFSTATYRYHFKD